MPEVFQVSLDAAFAGLHGVGTIVNNMLVCGEGDTDKEVVEDYFQNLLVLLDRFREKGLKLNGKNVGSGLHL